MSASIRISLAATSFRGCHPVGIIVYHTFAARRPIPDGRGEAGELDTSTTVPGASGPGWSSDREPRATMVCFLISSERLPEGLTHNLIFRWHQPTILYIPPQPFPAAYVQKKRAGAPRGVRRHGRCHPEPHSGTKKFTALAEGIFAQVRLCTVCARARCTTRRVQTRTNAEVNPYGIL